MEQVKSKVELKALASPETGARDREISYANYAQFVEQVSRCKHSMDKTHATVLFVNANFNKMRGYHEDRPLAQSFLNDVILKSQDLVATFIDRNRSKRKSVFRWEPAPPSWDFFRY